MKRGENMLDSIKKEKIVVIFRGLDYEKLLPRVELLLKNDLTIMEVTLNSPNALKTIENLKKKYGDQIQVGAGTVTKVSEVKSVKDVGGKFIISPHTDTEVIKETKQQNLFSIPGVMTPTEVFQAVDAGADMLKVFPATTLGLQFIKQLKGPFPNLNFMGTGGINANNAESYIQSGYNALGIGSSLTSVQDEGQLAQELKVYKNIRTFK